MAMVKHMSIITLKPGFDPDESYDLWRTSHAPRMKGKLQPELKEYTISRVVASFGETDVFGVAQLVFDDVESCQRAIERLSDGQSDDFVPRIAKVERIVIQEESVELN
jgi:uncharacterized protein (TIGR02118 family)